MTNNWTKFKNKPAFTLIETMIALAIFTISIEGFTLLFSNAWRNNNYTLEMGRASLAVSMGVGKMVNYVRGARQGDNGAFPIVSADDNDLLIYSDYDKNGTTERLHFYKDGQNVYMGVTDPSGTMPITYPSGDQSVSMIASNIVNTPLEPVFYYFNRDFGGDETVNEPLDTPADVSDIRIIKIRLKINIIPNRAPDNIEMQSFVEIRNLNEYDRIQ